MGNKKASKLRRQERRLAEIARAQSARQGIVPSKVSVETAEKNTAKVGYHELPTAEIKKDMIKNFAFLLFAIAVIAGIKISGWSL
ncbi:MAG: hypothetical protein UU90_C0020G0003 [candidate division WWE3 bacterium GW2011_GWD2_42_11]|uniref:Uncharacterized protein n=3 Tax=Katanobacteria TaxID=422282 RepID=A0A1F4VZS7_UNCKA|nr:MAG: hypothetical protein UU55_C0002G0097 [candidate division WWE3 bacterium GW2011_GWC2_41_23]KKS26936.1 MAG: hypothetical protein UU86_C0028G0011 [candidate division WWE3 bacterium GW2011_GWC1_42_102]KKS28679.1 MAG: hypothetical protein UU90_C0020G0003 [candidate division WWE3 bacterium GW2011_GWD2_42_11]KKS40971.1 MAG: hypothetical protein UV03_C0001G0096 [candidate division WWE3 bacterium GW2011_GWE1_42_16]KKS51293.1 MAG: hypothetical protein UV16_C0001G0012 [candidate division WWE3 bact